MYAEELLQCCTVDLAIFVSLVDHSLWISLDRLVIELSMLSLGYYYRPAWNTSVLSVYLSVLAASAVLTTSRHCLN